MRAISERFEVERVAGEGGMGTIFRARDSRSGAIVALKVLNVMSADERERFVREAEVLSELRHPAIVRYVAHGVSDDGRPYLAMEWLEGEDLESRLARGELSIEDSVRLTLRVAEALGVAHAAGVVHRDVKPSNLFLVAGDAGDVRVCDFGIARVRGRRPVTQTGMLVGTPGYMSPEQARGEALVDARADVFALGCVLFECFTGRPTFVGEHIAALLARVLLEDAPRVSELRPEIAPELDELVAQMLSKEPSARPADVRPWPTAFAHARQRATRGPRRTSKRRDRSAVASGAFSAWCSWRGRASRRAPAPTRSSIDTPTRASIGSRRPHPRMVRSSPCSRTDRSSR